MLGTDGFGRSDSRRALRRFFEVDRHYVAVAALKELADAGTIDAARVQGGDRALRDRRRRPDADHAYEHDVRRGIAVEVPDIGDFEDVPIIEILVSPGDTVAVDDPLLTLESDKATMDVPAPFAGTVRELLVKIGDKVSQGVELLTLGLAAESRREQGATRPQRGAERPHRSEAGRRRGSRARCQAEEHGRATAAPPALR